MNRELAETLLAQLIADELDEASRAQLLAYLKTDAELSETLGDMRIAAGLVHKGQNAGEAFALRSEQRAALEARIASGEESQQAASRRNAEGSETVSSDTGAASHSTLESIDPHDAPRLAASPDLNNESPPILFTLRGASAAAACVAISIGAVGLLIPSQGGADSPSASAVQENSILADAQAIGLEISEDVIPIQNTTNVRRAPRETRSIYSNSGGDLESLGLWSDSQNDIINTRYGAFAPGSNDEAGLLALALTQTHSGGANGGGGGGRGGGGRGGGDRWFFDEDKVAQDSSLTRETTRGEQSDRGGEGWLASGDELGVYWALPERQSLNERYVMGVLIDPHQDRLSPGESLTDPSASFGFAIDLPFDNGAGYLGNQLPNTTNAPSFDLTQALSNNSSTEESHSGFNTRRTRDPFNHAADVNPGFVFGREGVIPREAPQLAASPDLLTQSPAAETLGRQLDRIETRYRFGDEHFDEEYGVDLDIAFNTPNTDTLLNIDTDGDGIPDATDGLPDNGSLWEPQTIAGIASSRVDAAGALIDRTRTRIIDYEQQIAELENDLSNQRGANITLSDSIRGLDERASRNQPNPTDLLTQAQTQMAVDKVAEASEALAQGQVNLAAQLYEEALLLDPGNDALRGRLAQAQAETAQSRRPASPIAGAAQDRTIARQESIARYEESMQRASTAITNGQYDAAIDATNDARIVLNTSRSSFGQSEYNEMQARAARMTAEVNSTQQRNDAMASADAERIRFRDERSASAEAERAQHDEVVRLLHAAREQQLARNYDQALRSLEAAQFLDPDNPAVEALQEIIRDVPVAVDARPLKRDLNVMRSNQQLINDEAIIPYDELLTYPGDWPQLTQMRLQGLDSNLQEYIESEQRLNDREVEQAILQDQLISLQEQMAREDSAENTLRLRNQVARLAEALAATEADLEEVRAENDSLAAVLGTTGLAESANQSPSAPINGEIVSVDQINRDITLVALNLGERDGIKPGMTVTISRGDEYLGTVAIEVIDVSTCVGRIVRGTGEPFREGDTAIGVVVNPTRQFSAAEANRTTELALRRIVSLDVEAVELQDVIDYIRDATGANIAVNWPALELEGITPDQPISINLSRVPAELLLRLALEQAGAANQGNDKPGYLITEGVLVISTLNDLGAEEPDVEPTLETETPANYPVNPWVLTQNDALSTFAVDVDTASYQLARRHIIERAQLPAASSIRMEEFVNRFDYNYPAGQDAAETFRVHLEAGPAPFADEGIVLVKVGIRGRVVARDQQKPAHLVFVIDASGSMAREDRLPLVQQSLAIILEQLGEDDTVTLVSYDTAPYLLIEHASVRDKTAILEAALSIQTRGSTNLIDGMRLGYQVAARHFESGAVNRVILCSDGVANVGSDDAAAMLDAISQYRQQGVTLTTLGVGIDEVGETGGQSGGGLNDHLLERLANRGDGRYLYIGSRTDAHRLLATELSATAPIIARDVKIQVAFDPTRVRRYRLIGYENRAIADADFRNDSVDAGEVFSGQSATALYEIELHPPRNQDPRNHGGRAIGNERQADLGQVFVRYHDTRTGKVEETQCALSHDFIQDRTPSDDPRYYLAACAAEFAERLRESEHSPGMVGGNDETLERLISQVAQQLPLDTDVAELKALIEQSRGLPRSQ